MLDRATAASRLVRGIELRRATRGLTTIRRDIDQLLRRSGATWEMPEHEHLVRAGSGPYLHDYLIDDSYEGPSGQEFRTNHGHIYRAFSTIQGAINDADGRNGPFSFGIAPGNYPENVTLPATISNSAHMMYFYSTGERRVFWGNPSSGVALTIATGTPIFGFKGIFFRCPSASYSVQGSASNIEADFEDCEFTSRVSADFAGAYFDRCQFGGGGYIIDSGHTPAVVTFQQCYFPTTIAMVWVGGSQDHWFENCVFPGAANRIEITGGTNTDLKFVGCTLETSGAAKRFFLLNGAAATMGGLAFIGCDFGAPADANGCIYFQDHNGFIGFIHVGNQHKKVNGVQNDYITSDVEVNGAAILTNAFGYDGFSGDIYNEQESAASSSVEGLFRNSIFGPNVPGQVAQYDITGVENEFYPASSAIGASVPSPLQFLASISRQQAHAVAVR